MGARDLVANGKQVAVIEYHYNDSFTNSYGTARRSYYGNPATPTAKFDGVQTFTGGNHTTSMYPQYLAKYNIRIVIPSSFHLEIFGTNSGNNYNITVQADKVATYTGPNPLLHMALTQSNIAFNWQGQTELDFVERLMVPNQNGTTLDFNASSSHTVNLNFTRDASWPAGDCELVVFLQNNTSKEVLQAIKIPLNDLLPPLAYDAALTDVFGLPQTSCTGEVSPVVTLKNIGGTTLTSATINYSVNNGALNSMDWNGNLSTSQQTNVSLPEITFPVLSNNTIKAYVTNPNGQVDQNHANDTTTGAFVEAGFTTSVLYLELKTDNFPGETSWNLQNSSGDILYSGGPYAQANTIFNETFELSEEDCYRFTILDAGGNGLGTGYYKLTDYFNQVFVSGGGFDISDIREFSVSGIIVDVKAILEGPYSGMQMNNFLTLYGYTPLSQPYNQPPWNYNGTESILSYPTNYIVDWILLELRDAPGGPETATAATTISRRAVFLHANGKIVDLDGTKPLTYNLEPSGNLYAVVIHRNHLSVLSNYPLTPAGRVYQYDFSTGMNQAFGGNAGHKNLGNGVWGMISGDGNSNGQVNNTDKVEVWASQSALSGYLQGDFDLNSNVDNLDKIESWAPNSGFGSQVPY